MNTRQAVIIWQLLQLALLTSAAVQMQDGRYSGLQVAVASKTIEPLDGLKFIADVQNFIHAGSELLNYAMDKRVSINDFTLMIPRTWNASNFGSVVRASDDTTIKTADILLHDAADELPETLQAELCGVPGRQVSVPLFFLSLSEEEQKQFGSPGKIFAHEWAHYRWGVHDEHGFGGDDVYSSTYGNYQTAMCIAGTTNGTTKRDCSTTDICEPGSSGCYFCFGEDETADQVQASLSYMPALSTGKFCDAATHVRNTPSPQNVLCGGRSIMEVIQQHPDHLLQ
ncbi:calcium-activated chloride channel regulator 2 [Hyalella azteca]|uniref:Calcium-activated chloride channel regulator 2 n=1 Tax=Hyalella azteca TaxID=294128 RepID=A0A8B7NFT1_HYAAZ|nr:calcium-activated chloride channel regulator 2 [Hyalella azteca]